MKNEVDRIVEWLQKQVKQAGAKGLVVGVSGGLDSAVVAFLMKRAFPSDSLGVVMPIQSSEQDVKDAYTVVQTCKISYVTADLTAAHEEALNIVLTSDDSLVETDTKRMADANLRARIRMSALYTYATLKQYLVVGTDN